MDAGSNPVAEVILRSSVVERLNRFFANVPTRSMDDDYEEVITAAANLERALNAVNNAHELEIIVDEPEVVRYETMNGAVQMVTHSGFAIRILRRPPTQAIYPVKRDN